jgi:4-aminobutyrate aminotransferase/(S)-3-amino-2-methylpropionate transaminase
MGKQYGVFSETIEKQIDQLFSSILIEQKKFDHIKGPDEDKKDLFKTKLAEYQKRRGRDYFFSYLSSGRGHGPFTEMIDGSVKYDLIGGIGVNLFGHSHPLLVRACLEAATLDTLFCGHLQPYPDTNELTRMLLESVQQSRLRHFWFSCSGSFSNDVALKILWQKQAPKYTIIAFKKTFAGRSVATQDITDKPEYREGMPKTLNVAYVPHFDQNDPENSLSKTLKALDEVWNQAPDTFAALTIEIVQGEGGFIFGTREFYVGVFEWAKSKGIYIWVDEVQSFARTHQLFAFQMFQLDSYVDVLTVGKALQSCGTFYTEELNPKAGLIAGTFAASMPSLLAGQKILKFLLEGSFYGPEGRMIQIEKKFKDKLQQLKSGTCQNKISYFGGVGTMISFEVGDSGPTITNTFVKKLFENGVVVFTAGKAPTRFGLLVPITLTDHHIDEIFTIIEKTILEVVA